MNKAVPFFGKFLGGRNLNELKQTIIRLERQNIYPIIDYIKEVNGTDREVDANVEMITKCGTMFPQRFYAIKMSAFIKKDDDIMKGYDKCNNLIFKLLMSGNKVMIDAENVLIQDSIDKMVDDLIEQYNGQEVNIFKTYQMYRRDSYEKLYNDLEKYNNLGVKLVRGGYYHMDKYTGKLFGFKEDTDKSYEDGCMAVLLQRKITNKNIGLIVATHNHGSIKMIRDMIRDSERDKNFTFFAQLLGMNSILLEHLNKMGFNTMQYVPYGKFIDTLPYMGRRLYENYDILKYSFF